MMSLQFFDKRDTGTLIERVIGDTRSLQSVLVEAVQGLFSICLLF